VFSNQRGSNETENIDEYEGEPYFPTENNGTTLYKINSTAELVAM